MAGCRVSSKHVAAAEFKAKCLRIINEMQETGEPVIVTRRGRPVAIVSLPPSAEAPKPSAELRPIEPAITVDSVRLPGSLHADPADRFLIATARHWSSALVTADAKILDYSAQGHVRAVDAGQ